MSLFEVSGSVPSGFGSNVNVKLLVPVAAFVNGTPAHAFDNRHNNFGCTADHYDSSTSPPPADAEGGTVTISGYSGGSLLLGGSASSTITCTRGASNYSCSYSNGKAVEGQPFSASANPLGSGPITFSGAGGTGFGTFMLNGSPVGTLTVTEDLGKVQYSSASDTTLHYACSNGSCSDSIILVSILATQASASNPSASSPTSGLVSCAVQGGSSVTIPSGAIDAMFATDSSLKTVVTTIVRASANVPSAHDSNGQLVIGNVGKGVLGIASR